MHLGIDLPHVFYIYNRYIFFKKLYSIKKTIFILLVVTTFFSCASGNDRHSTTGNTDSQTTATQASAPAYDNSLGKGKVIETVICNNDKSQSYALYLPSYYESGKSYPCIYFYDAHARGAMPVQLYENVAEKYGFVLIGSNVSKNGVAWDATNAIVKVLMQDSRARINIDPKRIYASGFSGGSRVASSIAIIDGGIAGVIGCAAGFPNVQQAIEHTFDYFGMVGEQDFNLTEMSQLDETLEQKGFMHQLLTFTGIHGWPPVTDFETAMLWIQVNAMKAHIQTQNDTLVNKLKNDFAKRITIAKNENDLVIMQRLLVGMTRVFDGLADITSYKKQLAALVTSNGYKQVVALHVQLQQQEANLQEELAKEFPAQSVEWWSSKIAALNKDIHAAKTKQASQMNQRVLNYLGLVSYMYSDHALKSGDLTHADNYLKIFKIADPKNPDCHYLRAIYYVKKGAANDAFAELTQAVSTGYNDLSQLLSEPAFVSIQNDVRFEKIRDKVKGNILVN